MKIISAQTKRAYQKGCKWYLKFQTTKVVSIKCLKHRLQRYAHKIPLVLKINQFMENWYLNISIEWIKNTQRNLETRFVVWEKWVKRLLNILLLTKHITKKSILNCLSKSKTIGVASLSQMKSMWLNHRQLMNDLHPF